MKPRFELEGSTRNGLRLVSAGAEVPLIADYGTPAVLEAIVRKPITVPAKAVELDRLYQLLGRKLLEAKKAGKLDQRSGEDLVSTYVETMREWRKFVAESMRTGVPLVMDFEIDFWKGRLDSWMRLLRGRGVA